MSQKKLNLEEFFTIFEVQNAEKLAEYSNEDRDLQLAYQNRWGITNAWHRCKIVYNIVYNNEFKHLFGMQYNDHYLVLYFFLKRLNLVQNIVNVTPTSEVSISCNENQLSENIQDIACICEVINYQLNKIDKCAVGIEMQSNASCDYLNKLEKYGRLMQSKHPNLPIIMILIAKNPAKQLTEGECYKFIERNGIKFHCIFLNKIQEIFENGNATQIKINDQVSDDETLILLKLMSYNQKCVYDSKNPNIYHLTVIPEDIYKSLKDNSYVKNCIEYIRPGLSDDDKLRIQQQLYDKWQDDHILFKQKICFIIDIMELYDNYQSIRTCSQEQQYNIVMMISTLIHITQEKIKFDEGKIPDDVKTMLNEKINNLDRNTYDYLSDEDVTLISSTIKNKLGL